MDEEQGDFRDFEPYDLHDAVELTKAAGCLCSDIGRASPSFDLSFAADESAAPILRLARIFWGNGEVYGWLRRGAA